MTLPDVPNELESKAISVEIESVTEAGVILGYASLFGEVDQGNDVVMPGAFKAGLDRRAGRKMPMLFMHDQGNVIGHWTEVSEDDKGLRVKGQVNLEYEDGRTAYARLKAGDVSGLSIGYRAVRATRDKSTGIRSLHEVDLWEVSVVTFPMLESAQVDGIKAAGISIPDLRSMTERQIQDALTGKRDASRLSRSAAILLMKGGLPAIHATRDAGEEKTVHRVAEAIINAVREFKGAAP